MVEVEGEVQVEGEAVQIGPYLEMTEGCYCYYVHQRERLSCPRVNGEGEVEQGEVKQEVQGPEMAQEEGVEEERGNSWRWSTWIPLASWPDEAPSTFSPASRLVLLGEAEAEEGWKGAQ